MKFVSVITALVLGTLLGSLFISSTEAKNDPVKSTVAITTPDGRRGGTGIILSSKAGESRILTNSHVCKIVERGAVVQSQSGVHIITSYKHAENHDLCLIIIEDNLHVNTAVAKVGPVPFYEQASISGHPALFPTVVTRGHVSGDQIIEVLVGRKKCTPEDAQGPKGLLCILLGGLPDVRTYNATLVSATIMPGSSGSGVYNSKDELIGVAFAGQGNLGYAFTVPYDSMMFFLQGEKELPFVKAGSLTVESEQDESKREKELIEFIQKIRENCANPENRVKMGNFCRSVVVDQLYRE